MGGPARPCAPALGHASLLKVRRKVDGGMGWVVALRILTSVVGRVLRLLNRWAHARIKCSC